MRTLCLALCTFGSLSLLGCPTMLPTGFLGGDSGTADAATAEDGVEELGFNVTAMLSDGGTNTLTFDPAGPRPEVESTQELEVTTRLPLKNYRLRIFDEAERAMVSNDEVGEGPEGLRYRIRFAEPLKSGYRYTLVLDAQSGTTAADARGRAVPDQRLEFAISGERVKPVPEVRPKKRGKRRGR